jgi:hypothetical protein
MNFFYCLNFSSLGVCFGFVETTVYHVSGKNCIISSIYFFCISFVDLYAAFALPPGIYFTDLGILSLRLPRFHFYT